MKIAFPDRDHVYETSEDDPIPYYYKPITGIVYRQRLKATAKLLGKREFDKLLEIGYGSGIFLPELYRHCSELYGVDVHSKANFPENTERGACCSTVVGGGMFVLSNFQRVCSMQQCVSVLEHIRELDLLLGRLSE